MAGYAAHMFMRITTCLALLGLAGCVPSGGQYARERAVFDLRCPSDQIAVKHDNDVSEYNNGAEFDVRGCGRRARYLFIEDKRVGIALKLLAMTSVNAPVVAAPPPPPADLDALAEHRVDLARKHVEFVRRQARTGLATPNDLAAAERGLAVAARDSGLRGMPLLAALTEYRDAMIQLADHAKSQNASGALSEDGLDQVEGELAEAQYWLAEAEARP